MDRVPNVLLMATTSYAGMGPYVVSIVNSFLYGDNIHFFLVEREDYYYSKNIKPELRKKVTIVFEKTPNKFQTLLNLLGVKRISYKREIKKLCEEKQIQVVHALSSLTDIGLAKDITRNFELICTLHDLTPHEAKKVFYKEWRQNIMYKRIFKAITYSHVLHTNSLSQLKSQKELYPDKKHFYTPFPTLITEEIANGTVVPDEIRSLDKYILFFGRIEVYKGVELLIKAYNESTIQAQYKLVIAGKGKITIPVNNPNIILINRYIDDNEIKVLYQRASCVVYPYISATQSGVLSVATFFGTPIIASNLPFFREILPESYPLLCEPAQEKSLMEIFNKLNNEDLKIYEKISKELYAKHYDSSYIRESIRQMYCDIIE